MTDKLQLNAEIRNDAGKGASRRLRREDKIPAIIYGAGKKPQAIALDHKKVTKILESEDAYTQILTMELENHPEKVVLKDMQRHVCKPRILHMDFLRISATEKLTMTIPLHFVGGDVAPGVKEGGVLSHVISDVEIRCLPADLPRFIEVDVSNMKVNDTIHLGDLILPKGVELAVHGEQLQKLPVATLNIVKVVEEVPGAPVVAAGEVPATEAAAAQAAPAQPEAKGKEKK
jgi:large subunit ribosomal protein L25